MSEVFFRQFLATLSDTCLVASERGDILDLNPAACGILGYRKEELIGKPLRSIFAPESHSKVVDLLEELKTTRRLRADKMNVLTKKGERRIMLLSMGSAVDAEGRLLYSTSMLVDITDRERDGETLLQYAAILESSDDAIIAKSLEGVILSWNAAAQRIFGYTPEEAMGQSITIIIPPELCDEEIDILRRLRAGERIEHYETLRISKDGSHISVSITISPILDARGRIIGASKIARDITERKRAEAAFSQRLIEAQEKERSWIARELHDDIAQRLALLALHLDYSENPAVSADQLKSEIDEASKLVTDLAVDIQALSHRLHSPKLEYLGLAVTAASFCDELSKRQRVEIEFESEGVPRDLPTETALCLFRVLQEALQNAIKHSSSRHFQVSLIAGRNQIDLSVRDSGSGFDATEAMKGSGLGLTSMRERLKLVHGELSIQSQLRKGTTIHARVPRGRKTTAAR